MRRAVAMLALTMLALTMLAAACASDAAEPGSPDGELDCGATRWTVAIDRPDSGGEPTPFLAMEQWATDAYEDRDHAVHVVSARTATVVIDESEVALIAVVELSDETFSVTNVNGCPGFESS